MCIRDRLNVVAFISEVLYVYYVIDNKEIVSMETHRFPFSITHQRSAANVRHVLINIFNVKILQTDRLNFLLSPLFIKMKKGCILLIYLFLYL